VTRPSSARGIVQALGKPWRAVIVRRRAEKAEVGLTSSNPSPDGPRRVLVRGSSPSTHAISRLPDRNGFGARQSLPVAQALPQSTSFSNLATSATRRGGALRRRTTGTT